MGQINATTEQLIASIHRVLIFAVVARDSEQKMFIPAKVCKYSNEINVQFSKDV